MGEMDSTSEALLGLGLSEREISIYLAALTVGTSTASALAQRTNATRSTAQYTCKQLSKKGLLRMERRGNTDYFVAEPPEKLLLLLHGKQQALHDQEQQLFAVIGNLRGLADPSLNLPRVRFFEGIGGLKGLYQELLDQRRPIDSFEDSGEMFGLFPEFVAYFVQTRMERGIVNRVICPAGNPINAEDPKELRHVRTVDPKRFPFSCDVKICDDYVGVISFDAHEPVGILIHHRDIARNFHMLFELLWQMLEEK
jgi:sugar-specific transcriptional regulator TrmB